MNASWSGRKLHFWLIVAWGVFAVPMSLWWRDSVFLVNIMSLYAILATHWSAYQGSRAEEAVTNDKDVAIRPDPVPVVTGVYRASFEPTTPKSFWFMIGASVIAATGVGVGLWFLLEALGP